MLKARERSRSGLARRYFGRWTTPQSGEQRVVTACAEYVAAAITPHVDQVSIGSAPRGVGSECVPRRTRSNWPHRTCRRTSNVSAPSLQADSVRRRHRSKRLKQPAPAASAQASKGAEKASGRLDDLVRRGCEGSCDRSQGSRGASSMSCRSASDAASTSQLVPCAAGAASLCGRPRGRCRLQPSRLFPCDARPRTMSTNCLAQSSHLWRSTSTGPRGVITVTISERLRTSLPAATSRGA